MSPSTDDADVAGEFHVVLAGGGSGGHVFPALAVGEEIERGGGRVTFVGSSRGPEERLVTERGIEFHGLGSRPVVGRGGVDRAAALTQLGISALKGRLLVHRLDPSVVLGTGGYASVPAVVGAALAGRPVVLLEPNRRSGAANRLLSRRAEGACVAFAGVGDELACPVWTTGVPVRRRFFEVSGDLPVGEVVRLLVLGGSQGAAELNSMLPEALVEIAGRGLRVEVTHQCGTDHEGATRQAYGDVDLPGIDVEVIAFIDAMPAALASHHLVVARAGAVTLAELCAVGRGAVLIPLDLAEGHQRDNAETLADAGAAVALSRPTAAELAETLVPLLGDRRQLERLGDAARDLGRPSAAADVTSRLREVAR